LRQSGEHELDAFRPNSASHCFDYEHSRLSCSQHLSETCASLLLHDLLPWKKRLGDLAFHGAIIRFGGLFGFAYGVVDHTPPKKPCL
jgi:hypothetical protein